MNRIGRLMRIRHGVCLMVPSAQALPSHQAFAKFQI